MRVIIALAVTVVGAFGTIVSASAQTGQEEAICRNDPNVFFCENFEDRPLGILAPGVPGYKNNGYGVSGNPTVQTDEKFDGARAIRLEVLANRVSGNPPVRFDTSITPQRTVYWRWYVKYSSNYIWSPVATKHNEMFTNGQADNGIFNFTSNNGISRPVITYALKAGCATAADCYFTPNMNGGFAQFAVNRWYCVESRVTMNSTGAATDGYVQGWIDGVQYYEYPNVNLNSQYSNPMTTGFFFVSYWNCDAVEDCSAPQYQHPTMYRYMDNVIGSTQRIGCLSSANTPTATPSAPLSLGLR
jgi:hypothetical protein